MSDFDAQPDAATEHTEPVAPEQPEAADHNTDEQEMFPAKVVRDLRKESAGYRDRLKAADTRADELAARLHQELVRGTGKLADPTDLPYNPQHLDDPEALTAAVDQLLTAKPHLRSRKPVGDVGQGQTSGADKSGPVDLFAIARGLL